MKLIELHILQSVPVSCLNRDDVGAPKTAMFGGVTRARISSQCLKRAIRKNATEAQPALFAAHRSRLFTAEITKLLTEKVGKQAAEALAMCAAHYLGKLDPKDNAKVKTLMFLSPDEYARLADLLVKLPVEKRQELADAVAKMPNPEELEKADSEEEDEADEEKEEKATPKTKSEDKRLTGKQFTKKVSAVLKSPIRKAFGDSFVKDAADIAIFGRMVASDHSLTIDGAGMFSHALSTHKADNDIDFFSAVDDLQSKDEAGAGMTGTLEFTSATYYRYAALNLDLLYKTVEKENGQGYLKDLSPEDRRQVVDAFIRATLLAIPSARHNSMNAHTPPAYVLGIYKDHGQPMQLVNAFEKPVWSKQGLIEKSVEELKAHHAAMKKTWNIETTTEVAIPDVDLKTFCQKLTAHVI